MKYIIGLLLLSVNCFAEISRVPKDWIGQYSTVKSFSSDFHQIDKLEEGYKGLLDYKQSMLDQLSLDEKKRWHLQSIKTELAVAASGELGIMGAGGEAALEFVWIKKKRSQQNLANFNEEIESEEVEAIQITSEMSDEAIKKEIAPIVDLAMSTGKIKRRNVLFKKLYDRALEFQKTIKEIENSPSMGPWYAYKYQLEIGISAEGHITPFLEIGNSLRLRMEWWKIAEEKKPLMLRTPQNELSDNAKFIAAIAQDLSFIDQNYFENGFKLNCMKVGVGTSVKGNLLIAKSKAHAKGSIFFLRNEIGVLNQTISTVALSQYGLGNEKISRNQFRQAIHKGSKIISFFADRAPMTDFKSNFELNVIEAEFELFTSGGIGLVTVEGNSGLTLFATRNVII